MPKKEVNIEVGKRITTLIEVKEIENVRKLALSIGMDVSQLSKVVKGELGLPKNWAIVISDKYNVNLDWLVRGAGEMIGTNNPNNVLKKGTDLENMANDILNLRAKVEVLLDEVAFLKSAPPKYPKEYWTEDLDRKSKELFGKLADKK